MESDVTYSWVDSEPNGTGGLYLVSPVALTAGSAGRTIHNRVRIALQDRVHPVPAFRGPAQPAQLQAHPTVGNTLQGHGHLPNYPLCGDGATSLPSICPLPSSMPGTVQVWWGEWCPMLNEPRSTPPTLCQPLPYLDSGLWKKPLDSASPSPRTWDVTTTKC